MTDLLPAFEDLLPRPRWPDAPPPGAPGGGAQTLHARPESASELAALLGRASALGIPTLAVGCGTRFREAPTTPDGPLLLVCTQGLDTLFEHDADDLTLRVGAGVQLEAVARRLADSGQRLPLLPYGAGARTVGGVLAAAAEGPAASAWGSVRDQVLGLGVAHPDGSLAAVGGRVVKNVTGYDLCRAHVGARGTLGLLHEATLRLRARPETSVRLTTQPCPWEEALERARTWARERAEVAAVLVTSTPGAERGATPAPEAAARVHAVVEGPRDLLSAAKAALGGAELALEETPAPWEYLASVPAAGGWRVSLSPSRLRDLVPALAAEAREVAVDARRGIVLLRVVAAEDDRGLAVLEEVLRGEGHALSFPCDPRARRKRKGRAAGERARLEAHLRRGFDPAGIMLDDLPGAEA
jgi:glycolate oxidase FAD binding subunit